MKNYLLFKIFFLIVLISYLILKNFNFEKFSNKKLNFSVGYRNDGFGTQYLTKITAIAYCDYKKYNYVHKKFKNISHNSNADKLNKFIGIPEDNNTKIDILENKILNYYLNKDIHTYFTDNVVEKLRKYYYTNPKPKIQNNNFIAIHIRRGDVREKNHNNERFTSNKKYNKIIKFIMNKYPNKPIKIFSEGKKEDFKDIKYNVIFELNKDIKYTFHSLVEAKVLVMCKSNFSYCAGILNKNTIYYIRFWNKPLKRWIVL